jgi:hypothetical protein
LKIVDISRINAAFLDAEFTQQGNGAVVVFGSTGRTCRDHVIVISMRRFGSGGAAVGGSVGIVFGVVIGSCHGVFLRWVGLASSGADYRATRIVGFGLARHVLHFAFNPQKFFTGLTREWKTAWEITGLTVRFTMARRTSPGHAIAAG